MIIIAMKYYDIHTHQLSSTSPVRTSILDIEPKDFASAKSAYKNQYFSCGIHPWYSVESESRFQHLRNIASDRQIVTIGETGLDKIKGPSFDVQVPLFKRHIELSEQLKKPLIIHAVKVWEELYHIRKDSSPSQPWIIHGFRGNPQITQQMAKAGFMFSIGRKFNTASLQYIPDDSLFLETDEDNIDIKQVYEEVARAMEVEFKDLIERVGENVRKVFPSIEN